MKTAVRLIHAQWLDQIVENIKLSETDKGRAALLDVYRSSIYRVWERIETAQDRALFLKHLDTYTKLGGTYGTTSV